MLERSIELSSEEMIDLNKQLREEASSLLKANNEIKDFFKKIEEVFFSIDLIDHKLIQISEACKTVYGLPPSAFYSNTNLWYEIILAEDRPLIKKNYPAMLAGVPFVGLYRIYHANGEIRWLETKIHPTLDATGALIRIDGVTSDVTQKKNAEIKLLESEHQYKELFNLSPVPKWISEDDSLQILSVNDAAIKHYGYSREKFLSMTVLDIHPNSEKERFLNSERKTNAQTVQNEGVWEHIKENGNHILVETISSKIVYRGKKARLTLANDVTERINAERAQKQAELNLRTILENTEVAYVLLDSKGCIISFNGAAQSLAQTTAQKDIYEGMYFVDTMIQGKRQEVIEKINATLSLGQRCKYESKYHFANGKTMWLSVSMNPITNSDGDIIGQSVAATDITHSKLAELKLKESNTRFQYASKATNDAIWEWDLTSDVLIWGEGYEKLFGYQLNQKREELKNRHNRIFDLDKQRVINGIEKHISACASKPWQEEYRFYKANKSIAYVLDRAYLIYDEQKKPLKMVGAMQDITEKKLAEIEKDKITADLLQRTSELEQFAYIVSHNLRAPLANIKGLMTLIKQEPINGGEQQQLMSMLTESADKLDDVVMDLTNTIRIKKDFGEKKEPISFSEIVNSVKISLNHLVDKEKVLINNDFSAIDNYFTIKSYMVSIFYNLISNSIKYKQVGVDPVINIKSSRIGDKIVLTFSDNGLGFNLGLNSGKLFGLYQRFHFHTEGKGLGLFMVKTQLEAIEGDISVKSTINKGSVFKIELPGQD